MSFVSSLSFYFDRKIYIHRITSMTYMALAENSKREQINVIVNKGQLKYLKSRGIGYSKFMRQAIKALKEEKFIFDYMSND